MTHSSRKRHASDHRHGAAHPIDEERIRARAYELYEKRKGAEGDPESDWYAAVKDVEGDREPHR